jgi:hypothetical protein
MIVPGLRYKKAFHGAWYSDTCNPSYSGGIDPEDCSLRPACAKSSQTSSQLIAVHDGAHHSLPAMQGIKGSRSSPAQGIKRDAFSKITNTKRAGGVAQVVDLLSCS